MSGDKRAITAVFAVLLIIIAGSGIAHYLNPTDSKVEGGHDQAGFSILPRDSKDTLVVAYNVGRPDHMDWFRVELHPQNDSLMFGCTPSGNATCGPANTTATLRTVGDNVTFTRPTNGTTTVTVSVYFVKPTEGIEQLWRKTDEQFWLNRTVEV